MVLSIKISNINDAPNIVMGWADAVISVYCEQSLSRPTYKEEIEQYIMFIDDVDEDGYTPITIDTVTDFINFMKSLDDSSKLLIHSRTGDRRASTLAYIYYMMRNINPPTSLYKLKQLHPNAKPISYIIKLAEEYLKIGNLYSSFINVWDKAQK